MIEQVVIHNYKSIKELQLPLTRLNVLIGSNGVGKSNFISFFELLHEMYFQRLGSYTMLKGGIDNLLYFGQKHSSSIHGLIDFDNTNAFDFTIMPTQGNKGYISKTKDYFNNIIDKKKQYQNWSPQIWDRDVEESKLKDNPTWRAGYLRKHLTSFKVYHFHDTGQTSPMKKMCNVSDNECLKEDGSNLAAYLYYLQERQPKAFKLIEGVIKSVAPYFKRFNLKPDRVNPQIIQLEWEEEGSDMYLNGYSFSDGTLRFIALATLLLQPELPEVIIIDEPELGLHPAAIGKLAAMIKRTSAKCQIIISTQASNLVNYFEPEDIVVVDREEKQSVFKRLTKEELATWMEEYSLGDIWEKNIIGGQP